MSLYTISNLTREFTTGDKKLHILQGVDLQLHAGEMTAIIGASGSGKTTLLQILGTLAKPTSGDLFFQGEDLLKKSEKELAAFRNKNLGFIFQFHHLLPEFSALENVMMPGFIAGKKKNHLLDSAHHLLEKTGLSHRIDHRISELSGGEQQRVALARALIMNPQILLADEPTGNLDAKSGTLVFDLLKQLSEELQLTTLMVTHNLDLARKMDHCFTLREGVLTDRC